MLLNGSVVENPKAVLELAPGDVLELQPAGGGGHGDPALRASSLVSEDLQNDLVSSWP